MFHVKDRQTNVLYGCMTDRYIPVQLRFMQQISYSGMVELCKYECL